MLLLLVALLLLQLPCARQVCQQGREGGPARGRVGRQAGRRVGTFAGSTARRVSWPAPQPLRTWQLVPVVETAGHVEADHCAVLGGERHGCCGWWVAGLGAAGATCRPLRVPWCACCRPRCGSSRCCYCGCCLCWEPAGGAASRQPARHCPCARFEGATCGGGFRPAWYGSDPLLEMLQGVPPDQRAPGATTGTGRCPRQGCLHRLWAWECPATLR